MAQFHGDWRLIVYRMASVGLAVTVALVASLTGGTAYSMSKMEAYNRCRQQCHNDAERSMEGCQDAATSQMDSMQGQENDAQGQAAQLYSAQVHNLFGALAGAPSSSGGSSANNGQNLINSLSAINQEKARIARDESTCGARVNSELQRCWSMCVYQ